MISHEQVRVLVEHRLFQATIIAVITINATTLGLSTSQWMATELGELLFVTNQIAVGIFLVELTLRIYAYGGQFFTNAWNLLDFVVIGLSITLPSEPFSVLRALRLIRVLRLISASPSMRRVVSGFLMALPGIASIVALLSLFLYTAAVMANHMFRDVAPEYFGDLASSLFSLLLVAIGEGWPDVARTIMVDYPHAWIFFVGFIVVTSFAVLNLVIAVIIIAMRREDDDMEAEAEERHAAEQAASTSSILTEIRAARAEVAMLKAEREQ